MKKVYILDRLLVQYRVDFYHKLKDELERRNISISLFYGKSKDNNFHAQKGDEVDIEWADYMPTKTFNFGSSEIIWQPYLKHIKDSDLIIVEQANRLLLNYYLMFTRKFTHYKIAFWGHYRNMQEDPNSLKNKFKSMFLTKSDWWFAYTEGQKKMLVEQNYPENQITVVQNAIDTEGIGSYYVKISKTETDKLKAELGINSQNVGIYCGGMYPEKRLDFILEACQKIKEVIPDFHMIFIGSGVDSHLAKEASKSNSWIHYLGPKFGNDRIKYFKLASVQLMPGLVGLGILDSFALETPIVTTKYPYHSPEIEYLKNGINGIITNDNMDEYSNTIIDIMNKKNYKDLIDGCKQSAKKYTIEIMVKNFADGVEACVTNKKNQVVENIVV